MAGARVQLRRDPAAKVGRCRMRPIVGLFPPDALRRVRLVSKTAHDRIRCVETARAGRNESGSIHMVEHPEKPDSRANRWPEGAARADSLGHAVIAFRSPDGLSGGTTGQLLPPPAHGSSVRAREASGVSGISSTRSARTPLSSRVPRRARAGSGSDTMRPTHVAKTEHLPSHSQGALGSDRLESPSYSSLYKYIIKS